MEDTKPESEYLIDLKVAGEDDHVCEDNAGDRERVKQEPIQEPNCSVNCEELNIADEAHNQALDDVIYKALGKVKGYFFSSKMDEEKLAEFMYKMLTLNNNDKDKDVKINPEILEDMVNEMLKNDTTAEIEHFNSVIDKLLGEDTARNIYDKLSTEKVDEIVEKLLGEDTKKLICERLESDNLEELLNKLVDEKLKLESDPDAKHPNFDEFIEKILGKDTEEFIRTRLEMLIAPAIINLDEELKIVEVEQAE